MAQEPSLSHDVCVWRTCGCRGLEWGVWYRLGRLQQAPLSGIQLGTFAAAVNQGDARLYRYILPLNSSFQNIGLLRGRIDENGLNIDSTSFRLPPHQHGCAELGGSGSATHSATDVDEFRPSHIDRDS